MLLLYNPCVLFAGADKRIIVWNLHASPDAEGVGFARRSLTGHSQCVQDVVISSDSNFALSGSWDKTLRLWDLNMGETVRTFQKHTSDVNSVAFSADNRQIVSGSRDRTVRLWNTLADCKYTIEEGQHTDWVSCVRFSPSPKEPLIVSCGWDKLVKVRSIFFSGSYASVPSISSLHSFRARFAVGLQGNLEYCLVGALTSPAVACGLHRRTLCGMPHSKFVAVVSLLFCLLPCIIHASKCSICFFVQVWSLSTCKLTTNLVGHTSVLYTVTISPDGSLCASGGKDGVAMLWDVSEGKHLYSLDASCTINSLCFSPCNYWLCAATDKSVKVCLYACLFSRMI